MSCWEKLFLLVLQVQVVTCDFKPVQMDRFCGRSLSMTTLNTYGVDVSLRRSNGAARTSNCSLVLENRLDQDHFHVNILQVSIPSCNRATLHIAERSSLLGNSITITPHICGSSASRYVNVSLTTIKRYLVIEYDVISATINKPRDSFRIAVNSYKEASRYTACRRDEYKCDNYRCIHDDLKCQGFNPCGDGSDCNNSGNSTSVSQNEFFDFGKYIGSIAVFVAFCLIGLACFKSDGRCMKSTVVCIREGCDCVCSCCKSVSDSRPCQHPCDCCDRCRPCVRDCWTSAGNHLGAARGRCGNLITGACACACCSKTTVQTTQPTSSVSVSYISNSESVREIPAIPDEPPPQYEPPEPSDPPIYSNAIMNPPDYSAYAKDNEAPPPDYDTVVANNTLYRPRKNSS